MFKLIKNNPAAYIKALESIVITDLHIGIEREVGINLRSNLNEMLNRINILREKLDSKKLIVLGDIKHEIFKEEKYLIYFFNEISKNFDEILITKGNHDVGLENFVKDYENIKLSKEFKIDNFGFYHGHSYPSKNLLGCKYLFLGHFEPSVKINNKVVPCFIEGKINRSLNYLILPPFNHFAGYLIINEENENLKILHKFYKISNAKIFLISGTIWNLNSWQKI